MLESVRKRTLALVKQYKSLSNYGRPVFESIDEVSVVYYLSEKLNIGLNQLSSYLGLDKTTLYGIVKKIKEKNLVSITDPESKKVKTVNVRPEELLAIAEEKLNVTSKTKVRDPLQSSLIKEFMSSDIERLANRDRRTYYNEREKLESVKAVSYLMNIAESLNLPTNPDYWSKEILLKMLDTIQNPKKRIIIKKLRRIPQFRNWLEGYVGAEKKYVNPKMSVLFYENYLKLKELYRNGDIKEQDFLIVWLHITTGAREGYSSENVKLSDDLESVNTSLIGLKWENLEKMGESWILKIYEHKTAKIWTCDLSWLDPEILPILLKYRKDKGSIIKTLTGLKTVSEFEKYYRNLLKDISQKLNLEFTLTPHDLRRSHISILAELGIPLEIAVSGLMDFGVGWEDLSTALIFYTRFSKHKKESLLKELRERQKQFSF